MHNMQPPSEWSRQMDGQTDGSQHCFMPPAIGGGALRHYYGE